MSHSFENLHDFVLNLVNDEVAKAAYAADPLGVLADAGLGDLTPDDVTQAIPLVTDGLSLDSLPLDGLPLDGLPVDGLPLDSLPLNALPVDSLPLDAVTDAVSMDGLPLDALPLDALPLDAVTDAVSLDSLPLDSLPLDAVSTDGLPSIPTPLGDLTVGVPEAPGLSGYLGVDGEGLSSANSLYTSNPDNNDAPTLSSYTESELGDFAAGAKLDPEEFGGSAAGTTELGDFGVGLVGHSDGSVGAWGGADTVLGDVAGGLLLDKDGLALAAESPLGDVTLNSETSLSIEPANPADLLDAEALGDTGDAVVGTVASAVGTGADTLSGALAGGADSLGGLLPEPVGDVVEAGTNTVVDGIQTGGDAVSEGVTAIPATDGLPLDQLPELPVDLPALPELDVPVSDVTGALPVGLEDLPVGLDDLPVELPSLPVDLPVDLPALPANPVVDVVDSSPVGGVADTATSALSPVTDLTDDLGLGLL